VIAEVDSLDLIKNLVARRGGYALLLEMSIKEDVKAGVLSAAKVIEPEMIGHVCLVHGPKKTGNRASREIGIFARQVAEDSRLTSYF
jgi:DNA-binding transcriptional LysR family regulator